MSRNCGLVKPGAAVPNNKILAVSCSGFPENMDCKLNNNNKNNNKKKLPNNNNNKKQLIHLHQASKF